MVADGKMVDQETADGRNSSKIWRCSRDVQAAADARQLSWERGSLEGAEDRKNLGGGSGSVCSDLGWKLG